MEQAIDSVADWQAAAGAWARHAVALAGHTRPVREAMVDLLAPRPGEDVLEVAAGIGELSRDLADHVGPDGSVRCTDAAPAMVQGARDRVGMRDHVEVQVADVRALPLPDGAVDAVACQMGLMLLARPDLAAAECRRVLGPQGRLVVATWGPMSDNPWLTLLGIGLLTHGHALPGDPTGPGGVCSLSAPDDLTRVLVDAGFEDVQVRSVDAPARHPDPAHLWEVRSETSGPLTRLLAQLSDADLAAVRETCLTHAAPFRGPDGACTLPGRALVAVAR